MPKGGNEDEFFCTSQLAKCLKLIVRRLGGGVSFPRLQNDLL